MLSRIALGAVATLLLAAAGLAMLAAKSRQMPAEAGLVDGRLRPCPATPNCVCSEATDAKHYIAPIRGEWSSLRATIVQLGGEIRHDDGHVMHAVFRSPLFGFVDDFEARQGERDTIQIRSASRVGRSDLGANRRRVEKIRHIMAIQFQSTRSHNRPDP